MIVLQQQQGCHHDVIIESGNVPAALNRAARDTLADRLVIGHPPSGGHLGAHGAAYGLVHDSVIPVLSI